MLLIQNCQLWKYDSFSELYERYADEIYKFVFLKVYEQEKAEDITSEVFMKAINSIQTFTIGKWANFRAWLYKIAYNQVIDSYKKAKENISLEDYVEKWLEEDIWKKIDDKDKLKKVFQYLETEKKDYKDVVIMRVWDWLSYKEIAHILGKSEVNCKKIFSRAIAVLNANICFLILLGLIIV